MASEYAVTVGGVAFPGGTPAVTVLNLIHDQCHAVQPGQGAWIHLHGRLRTVLDALERTNTQRERPPPSDAVDLFVDTLTEYWELLKMLRDMNVVERLLRHHKVHATLKSLNETVDQLVQMLALTDADNSINWKEALHQDMETQRRAMENVASSAANIMDELRSIREQGDAIVLLRAEIARMEKCESELPEETQSALRRAFKSLVRSSRVAVEAVPEWYIAETEITIGRAIGRGSYGVVYCGLYHGNAKVVVKMLLPGENGLDAGARRDFLNEVTLWSKFNHPHVLKMYGACHVSARPFIVCEEAENGNMAEFLAAHESNKSKMWQLLYTAAQGLEYLHRRKVVHGDLKLSNLLVDGQHRALVSDFGLSRVKDMSKSKSTTKLKDGEVVEGGLRWRAPECFEIKPTFASDVFSFGMCIVEALTGEPPYGHLDDVTVRMNVENGMLPPRPEGVTDDVWDLVLSMTKKDRHERLRLDLAIQELKTLADRELERSVQERIQACSNCASAVRAGDYCSRCGTKCPSVMIRIQSSRDVSAAINALSIGSKQQQIEAANALRGYTLGDSVRQDDAQILGAISVLVRRLTQSDDDEIRAFMFAALVSVLGVDESIPITLESIPEEILRGGEDAIVTHLRNAEQPGDSVAVYRSKMCTVGPSNYGKSSLIKSIASKMSTLVDVADRTIGIDLFPLTFTEGNPVRSRHDVTCWDFAGQEVYQVAHALFFSTRTLYLVCVDLCAYGNELKTAQSLGGRNQQSTHMRRYLAKTVSPWVRLVLARQPDAEFILVGTKRDLVAEGEVEEATNSLEGCLGSWCEDLLREESERRGREDSANERAQAFQVSVKRLLQRESWLVTSSRSDESVSDAFKCIERAVIAAAERRSVQLQPKYLEVLGVIDRTRRVELGPAYRVGYLIVPFDVLYGDLKRAVPTLESVDECRAILRTLHALGEILWYEDHSAGILSKLIILDPTIVLDAVREVVNHKLSEQTGERADALRNEGKLTHASLIESALWWELSKDEEILCAFKHLLQFFQLAYPTNSNVLNGTSDLIVPAYWVANWQPTAKSLRHQQSTLKAEAIRGDTIVCWEYTLSSEFSKMVFQQFCVKSHSSGVNISFWANAFEGILPSKFKVRASVATGTSGSADQIRIEVAAASMKVAWEYLRHFVMRMEIVLEGYPGLEIRRCIVELDAKTDSEFKHTIEEAIHEWTTAQTLKKSPPIWLPSLTWYMQKAWQSEGIVEFIETGQIEKRLDALRQIVIAGDKKRRLPGRWLLRYTEDRSRVQLLVLSDISGNCYHEAIEITVPPRFLAEYGTWLQVGVSILSNIAEEAIPGEIMQKATELAESKLDHAQAIHKILTDLNVQEGAGVDSKQQRGAATELLRKLLTLHNPSFNEVNVSDLTNLVCACNVEGFYVWAHRLEIEKMPDDLTPCDPDDMNDIQSVTASSSSSSSGSASCASGLAAKLTTLQFENAHGFGPRDWRSMYCRWELVWRADAAALAGGKTMYHTTEGSEPAWSDRFEIPSVKSIDSLRDCRLRFHVKRPSWWRAFVREIHTGSVNLMDYIPQDASPGDDVKIEIPCGGAAVPRTVRLQITLPGTPPPGG